MSVSSTQLNQNMGLSLDSFCIAYIVNRMHTLGFPRFHFEPYLVVLSADNERFWIQGQNEYYYLTTLELAVGTEIASDDNHMLVTDYFQNVGINKLQEFTGNIEISQPSGGNVQTIEFIRVIPDY